jgi:hypothetical protein
MLNCSVTSEVTEALDYAINAFDSFVRPEAANAEVMR